MTRFHSCYRRFESAVALTLTLIVALVIVLGVTYWLIRERDDRLLRGS